MTGDDRLDRRSGREILPLPPRSVHVWVIPLDRATPRVESLRKVLSSDEVERADRFHFDIHRRRFVVARGSMRRVLGSYLGLPPHELVFRYGPKGKPDLPGHPFLHFNLSHSEELALLAVTRIATVGVDVEWLRRPLDDGETLAQRFFSPRESARLLALPPHMRTEAFFNCWTRKEAYVKAVGEGLALGLDRFDVSFVPGEPARFLSFLDPWESLSRWSLYHLSPAPDYVGALALVGRADEVRLCREPQDATILPP